MKQLLVKADILFESFRPGVMKRLGLDYKTVKAINKTIIYASLTGYGQTGPWNHKAGHDINYCALAGISDQQSDIHGKPVLGNFPIADLAGGSLGAATAILAALIKRFRYQQGSYLDLSMTDCALAHAVLPLAELNTFNKSSLQGQGSRSGGNPCYNFYRTKDHRTMALGIVEKKFWHCFCDILNRKDLKEKHNKKIYSKKLHEELTYIFKQKNQSYWINLFDATDCCVSPVLTISEALKHPQLQARKIITTLVDPIDGILIQTACPFQFDNQTQYNLKPAPRQGEHTKTILQTLGYEEKILKQMKEQNIIG